MIRRKSKLCKLFSSSLSDFSYDSFIRSYNPASEICPFCKSKGNCIKHAYYYRNVIHSVNERNLVDTRTRILRVKCNSCKHTHAVLPDFIIPYRIHSLVFITQVLLKFFGKSMTINAICRYFNLSKQLLCQWKSIYLSQRVCYLGTLNSANEPVTKILHDLYTLKTQPFLRDFFLFYGRSFLQLHANSSANSGQAPFWNDSDFTDPHNSCSADQSIPDL